MLQGSWQHVEGEFKSVMAIVTPCRSDQSTLGLAPYGHLADGRIQLVLVHKCSVLQYLRFLAAIPQAGKLHCPVRNACVRPSQILMDTDCSDLWLLAAYICTGKAVLRLLTDMPFALHSKITCTVLLSR